MNTCIGGHMTSPQFCPRTISKLKLVPVLCCAVCVLMLSGCSAAGASLLRNSDIITEEDYQSYMELWNSKQLDGEGHYIAKELEDETPFSPPAGSIHVTFAENAYISVEYYSDAALKKPIDLSQCYMMPGETIYASEPVCRHPSSNRYRFDRFCIYSYDVEGNRGEEIPCKVNESSPLAIQIPENYEGTDLAVVPAGKYENRQLELSDHYIDNVGQPQELDGTWIVNDAAVSSDILTVTPTEALAVDYQYDPAKYSFVASNPSSFYHEKGLVRFEVVNATEEIDTYSVELRPLEGRFLFDPSNFKIKNGTVTFKYLDQVVTGAEYIPDGGILQYTANPNSGYLCANRTSSHTGRIYVNTSDPDKTNAEIREAVKFYSDGRVQVGLPRPVGGTIEYTANGKPLMGDTCTLSTGTIISMRFKNWNGWVKTTSDESYTVTEQATGQSVSLKNGDIDKVFTEADKHKPMLNVVLTNSVKANVEFDIAAPGIDAKGGLNYKGGEKTTVVPDPLERADRSIYSGKVGTYGREPKAITITAKNDTILAGSALKLDIVTKDTRGRENRSVRYIEELPATETIELYTAANVATSTTVYETVTVTISEVAVTSYIAPSVGHTTVRATLTDMPVPYTLEDGDVLEDSRNVEITLIPEDGYYIVGSKNDRGTYSETMKYAKWEKDAQKILEQHPAHKIWYVTLDGSDPYGTCVYKLDGTTVSGRIGVREGQKLTLEYTLTNSDKAIVRSGPGGFVGRLVNSKTESCNIPVSEALDGKVIRRSDYIQVR